MKYRLLDASEWNRLDELMGKEFIPSPDVASVAVAEDESGKITGLLFVQLVFHMEPLVLTSPKVSFERLYNVLYDALKQHNGLRFYCFSESEIIDRMANHLGLELLPYKVFMKEVE